MKLKYSAAAAVLSLAAVNGQAAERIAAIGPYIGANIGYVTGRVSQATTRQEVCQGDPTCVVTDRSDDTNALGLKLYGGFLFNQYFALEGGYFNLGEVSFEDTTNTGETYKGSASMQGINVDAVAHLPVLDQLSLFARAGVIYAELNKDYSYTGGTLYVNGMPKDMNPDKQDVGYKYGLGVQFDFTPALGVRGEWEGFHLGEADSDTGFDVNMVSVGVVYRFGVEPAPEPEPVILVKEVPVPAEPKVVEKVVEKEVVKEVEAEPIILKEPTERVVLAADALFDFDKSFVRAEGKAMLRELAHRLQPDDRLKVTGHTDWIGSDAYNMKLSERRANSVKDVLVSYGIAPSQIETDWKGEREPIATNETDEGRQANRRVEIDIYAAPKDE